MSTWTSLGHAMRRRVGAPSSHLESAGPSMSRNNPTPEEVISSAQHAHSARRYVGQDAYGFTSPSAGPLRGTLVGKKSTQASDPTIADKANRQNIERTGAQYRVTAKMPPQMSPEAGPTMANARTIPSVAGRQSPNFEGGVKSAY